MKRILIVMAALLAALSILSFAVAESGDSWHNLFGYVMETPAGGFVLMTDDEMLFSFNCDQGITVNEDDAVVIRYSGTLNLNSEAQSVEVTNVLVLSTFYGKIVSADGGEVVVKLINDDGTDGAEYAFSADDIDLVVGEDGMATGDDVEVCFKGSVDELAKGQLNKPAYVHMTVYGQIEDTME